MSGKIQRQLGFKFCDLHLKMKRVNHQPFINLLSTNEKLLVSLRDSAKIKALVYLNTGKVILLFLCKIIVIRFFCFILQYGIIITVTYFLIDLISII